MILLFVLASYSRGHSFLLLVFCCCCRVRGCGCGRCFWWCVVGCCFCCCCFYPKKTRLVHGALAGPLQALRRVKKTFPSNSRHSVYLDDRLWNGHLEVAQVGKNEIWKLGQSRLQLYRKRSTASRLPEQASPGWGPWQATRARWRPLQCAHAGAILASVSNQLVVWVWAGKNWMKKLDVEDLESWAAFSQVSVQS